MDTITDHVTADDEAGTSTTKNDNGCVIDSSEITNQAAISSQTDWVTHGTYVPLRDRIKKRIADGVPFFSLEFFPPKTANSVANFFARLDRFREGNPLFVDIAWHFGSDPGSL
ncbi:unnamed protein product [Onchocerca ochengi]|uniref:Methylenetetrahydrofolate reductase [NAD(P)H] n=1 Tax=Onchocerca ochengi TaxID=42157 RepID=A0A182EUY4_ONCOC|nr:unnamed protein product [Onchocerca ochengi]